MKKLIIHRFLLCVIALASTLISSNSYGSQTFISTPLYSENRSPFMQQYGIARPYFSSPLENDKVRVTSQFELANYLSQTSDDSRLLRIDGETWIWTNAVEFSIGNDLQLAIQLPWIKHGEGIADRFIYHFHDVLQLPQNGRTEDRSDEFFWLLRADGQTLYYEDNPNSGIGDLRFTVSINNAEILNSLIEADQWQFHIELPTGDLDDQTSNGRLDAGLSFIRYNPNWISDRDWLNDQALSFWYGFGASYVGHDRLYDDLDPIDFSLSGRTGVAWQFNDTLSLKAQLDAQTPIFDNDLRELGWLPIQASLGGEYQLSKETSFNFLLVEDLRPRTTPDAIFSFGISSTF